MEANGRGGVEIISGRGGGTGKDGKPRSEQLFADWDMDAEENGIYEGSSNGEEGDVSGVGIIKGIESGSLGGTGS
jgi:hypothetical protein